jgi:hypothetical protein
MKQLAIWLLVVGILSTIVFNGWPTFDYFWQAWEFLAAATAMLYNLFFAIAVYALHQQKGEGTLRDALSDGHATFIHLILRISLPTFFFIATLGVVFLDRHNGGAPMPAESVLWKLFLTLAAFISIMAGDWVTKHQLIDIADSHNRWLDGWIKYFTTRIFVIDLPFVIGYVGLLVIYSLGRYDSVGVLRPNSYVLLLQAFVGGASALEMMIQSAIHGFSEIGDRLLP